MFGLLEKKERKKVRKKENKERGVNENEIQFDGLFVTSAFLGMGKVFGYVRYWLDYDKFLRGSIDQSCTGLVTLCLCLCRKWE